MSKRARSSAGAAAEVAGVPLPATAPACFEAQFSLMKRLRAKRNAPVDEFGAHALADPAAPAHVRQYHTLTALQLSSQTRDQSTAMAMAALKTYGLTVEHIAGETSVEQLIAMIKPVGFYNRKAEFIKRTAEILLQQHGGRVPGNLEALMALPGVGPKMSHICLAEAFGVASGIGVDTHVHRIANDLRWVKSSDPEGTRAQLERFVPRAEWPSVNLELVGIGQMISQPAYRPRLAEALLELPGQDRRDALKMLIRLGFQVKAVGDEGLRARLSLDDEV